MFGNVQKFRGGLKILKLGKYPLSRVVHFHIATIFNILHPKAQNCEKHVFLAVLAWFWRIFALFDAFEASKSHRRAPEEVPKRLQEPLGNVKGRPRSSEGRFGRSKSHQRAPGDVPRGPQDHLGGPEKPPSAPWKPPRAPKRPWRKEKNKPKGPPKRSQDHHQTLNIDFSKTLICRVEY